MLEGIPNWEMMFNLLNIHSQAAHGVAEHQAAAPVTATATLRLEKLPRPIFLANTLLLPAHEKDDSIHIWFKNIISCNQRLNVIEYDFYRFK